MTEEKNKKLDNVHFNSKYSQDNRGLFKRIAHKTYVENEPIGKFYLHQITLLRDCKDRFEQLYCIKYENMALREIKTIENKTFKEAVNFLDKQRLITEKKSCYEYILSYSINYKTNVTKNGIPFVVIKTVDFEKEKLPMKKI